MCLEGNKISTTLCLRHAKLAANPSCSLHSARRNMELMRQWLSSINMIA
jgi:hypothetical protein